MSLPVPVLTFPVIDADHQAATDPVALLMRAYDRAIRACETFDLDGARRAIGVLREALDLESSASRSFDALYAWCEDAVEQRDFMSAAQCLRTLRDAWRRATQPDHPMRIEPRADLPVC